MELLFDTVNLADIRRYSPIYPITGVTSNPSIIKQEGKIDFFAHMRQVREMIGRDKTLHVQVTGLDAATMLQEAQRVFDEIDDQVYIKVPVTEEGLKAIRELKAAGRRVTATAIYTRLQGLLAILCDVDYLAPYCNRMANMDVDFADTIAYFRQVIDENGSKARILAASFKNVEQLHRAYGAGAQAATIQPGLLHAPMGMAEIGRAITDFNRDFHDCTGAGSILDL